MARGVTDAELDLTGGTGVSPVDATPGSSSSAAAQQKLLIRGSKMEQLTRILADVEEAIIGLERRGISLKAHAEQQDATTGLLPEVHAILRGKEHWFADLAEFNDFREKEEAAGGEISVSDTPSTSPTRRASEGPKTPLPIGEGAGRSPAGEGSSDGNGQPAAPSELHFTELHEVRTINRSLTALSRFFQEQK